MRLDKFICESTELTRSMAKKLLKSGEVTCDGEVVKDPSFKVTDAMLIEVDGNELNLIGERYIMMHKPIDTICSTVDEEYQSVLSLMDIEKPEALHIAGRLDVDTTGLILITSDGQWSHKITSPKKGCGKRYLVEVAEPLSKDLVDVFKQGIELKSEDGLTKPAELDIIDSHNARLTIVEGKYHQVKRMFAAVGNKVVNLHREAIGPIEMDHDLEECEWRYLTDEEIARVK
ncbi:16S rRNA pseudouridine(516) synthase RsuA [Shewanella sp. WXL01]|uniref:Pseudouridine synthase n=1 Tax=Shewanella maritima TaxID=2520507 RepID=A0A411PEP3_9GAMM|nr:16S rRNA pseudouridine(516) synthase RsuA [Shewanella maritima]NKF49901.1 16S rRNA pseudouridine(516) synthase RsuA [Shewanella sp. WXL01]QBF82039.1 16S rRNA pseudouridine(516) synthase RsuA [Shewanella maritima]